MIIKTIFLTFLCTFMFAHSLVIYTEENPPWNYKESSEITGVATKIVKIIQRDIGNTDEIKLVAWNRGYKETLEKKNHVLFVTAKTAQREDLFYWVGPIAYDSVYLYKLKSNPKNIKTLEDAKKVHTIDAGPINNAAYISLDEKGFENLSQLSGEIGSLESLRSNRVELLALGEYAFLSRATLEGLNLDEFENTGIEVYKYPLYIAISKKTDKNIVAQWRKSFKKLKALGAIDKVVEKELQKWK